MSIATGKNRYQRYFIVALIATCSLFMCKSYFFSIGARTVLILANNNSVHLFPRYVPAEESRAINTGDVEQVIADPPVTSSTLANLPLLTTPTSTILTTSTSASSSALPLLTETSSTLPLTSTTLPLLPIDSSSTLPTSTILSVSSTLSTSTTLSPPHSQSTVWPTSSSLPPLPAESSPTLTSTTLTPPLTDVTSISTSSTTTVQVATPPTVAVVPGTWPIASPSADASSTSTPAMPSNSSSLTYNISNILAVEPVGRYGNQMFQFASAYGIAKHKGRQLISRGHYQIADFFNLEFVEEVNEAVAAIRDLPRFGERGCCTFSNDLYELKGRESQPGIMLSGYFQSWVYFKDYSTDVRRMFTSYRPSLADQIDSFFASIASVPHNSSSNASDAGQESSLTAGQVALNETTLVGIHVRRGDMKEKYFMDYGFSTGETDFLGQAMLYFIKRFSHVTFIVCSDDVAWCRAHIVLPEIFRNMFAVHFCRDDDSALVHLGILSSCNHSIITGGTFGWWGAFLAGGETVYYKGYPQVGTHLEKGFSASRSDYYMPDWIAM